MLYILIALNVFLLLLIGLIIFFVLKDRDVEKKLREELETIKKVYDEKTNLFKEEADKAKDLANISEQNYDAIQKEIDSIKIEYENKEKTLNDNIEAKIKELSELEETAVKRAEDRVREYEKSQKTEIEKNMVDLVINVTKKVFEKSLTYEDHKRIIEKSISDLKMDD